MYKLLKAKFIHLIETPDADNLHSSMAYAKNTFRNFIFNFVRF